MSNESSQQPKRSYFELVVLGVVVMLGVAVMGGLLAWMNRPPTYTSTARFLLSQRRDVAANLIQPNLDPMVHVDKFRSEPFLTKMLAKLPAEPARPQNIKDLRRRLQITNIEGTDVVQVEYSGATPDVTLNAVNKVWELVPSELDDDIDAHLIAPPGPGIKTSGGLF